MNTETNCRMIALISSVLFLSCSITRGQFFDCSTGLLQTPTAEMNPSGSFMISSNLLNRHTLPSTIYWDYHTFNYGINITFMSRLEVGYVMTLIDGSKKHGDVSERYRIMRNQDRHFTAKVLVFKEGEFGLNWMPALAVGFSDPTTGARDGDYVEELKKGGNAGFNRYYIAATKHFQTKVGEIGAHLGYQYNSIDDVHYNAPCAAIDWKPIWLQKENVVRTKLISEFDGRTFNLGAIVSLWRDHFDAMIELQAMKWITAGVRYKLVLKS